MVHLFCDDYVLEQQNIMSYLKPTELGSSIYYLS